jgi:hypothetical protein
VKTERGQFCILQNAGHFTGTSVCVLGRSRNKRFPVHVAVMPVSRRDPIITVECREDQLAPFFPFAGKEGGK